MIGSPPKPALTRGPAGLPSASGPAGGDADNPEALAAFDARVTSLVARVKTPDDEALERQRAAFDFIAQARAEFERETNALRDLAMEQIKHDDELLKKWIELI